MAKKPTTDAEGAEDRGEFDDIIGIVLLMMALLLLLMQVSFDAGDLSFIRNPPNHPGHNWIGTVGAYAAYLGFFILGFAAYLLPPLFGMFGVAFLFGSLTYLRQSLKWSLLWAVVLLLSITGLMHLAKSTEIPSIAAQGAGGFLGWL